jgi:hypothetical protein
MHCIRLFSSGADAIEPNELTIGHPEFQIRYGPLLYCVRLPDHMKLQFPSSWQPVLRSRANPLLLLVFDIASRVLVLAPLRINNVRAARMAVVRLAIVIGCLVPGFAQQ